MIRNRKWGLNFFALGAMFLFLSLTGGFMAPVAYAETDICCDPEVNSNCAEVGGVIQAMKDSRDDAIAKEVEADTTAREQTRQNVIKSKMKEYLGGFGTKYCFSTRYGAFFSSILSALGDPLNLLSAIISQVATQIMNAACDLATDTLNNLLNSICIPLPTLNLDKFSLDGGSVTYCDGISPADYIEFVRRPINKDWIPKIPTAEEIFPQTPGLRWLSDKAKAEQNQ
ncbi:MAG: hypothetical protein AB7S81_06880 [Bdellovibrionales bacterium]